MQLTHEGRAAKQQKSQEMVDEISNQDAKKWAYTYDTNQQAATPFPSKAQFGEGGGGGYRRPRNNSSSCL